ncbi:MAG: tautomerase family protein [Gammaproteobacteria bacterium]|nr:tautomerase family protein [Gammaproteobacteria bacterium]MDH5800450.1 tautomerase family protein [Gammaproteobacteria bacterium]
MPTVTIEVKRHWSAEQKQQILTAIHGAMVDALKIPEHDKLMRFIEHSPENFVTPPDTSDNYTLVEVSLFSGRSLDAKRALYAAIVAGLQPLGIDPMDIRIVLYEVPPDNWGLRGGIPASELNFGFKRECDHPLGFKD